MKCKNVFISYPSQSKDIVEFIVDFLEGKGIKSIWVDEQHILPGQNISQRLIEGVNKSACCILLLNEHSLRSTWCMAEVGAFWGANKPIIIYPVEPRCEVPPHLAGIRHATNRRELLKACKNALEKAIQFEPIESSRSTDPLLKVFQHSGLVKAFRIPIENPSRDKRVEELVGKECERAGPKSFRLVASSGYNYLHPNGKVWLLGLGEAIENGAEFSVILESPFSLFAETRALANHVIYHQWEEKIFLPRLEKLDQYDNVTINVTEYPINCSLFFTHNAVFYDPYLWALPKPTGRTENNFWVFEFRKADEPKYDCYDLLKKHFDFLASTSTPLKEFLGKNRGNYIKRTEEFHQKMGEKLKSLNREKMTKNLLQILNPHYHYSPIAYHDSWISVDPIIGCQLNCQYCFLQMTQWTEVKPQQLYPIPQIIDMLLSDKHFTPDQTILCFGNQTDPFLPDNVTYTLRFFKVLETHKLKNPVVIVTKKLIPDSFIDEICNLEYVKPIFCLSYSGLPKDVEKGVNPEESRKNFQKLSKHRLPVIHFWRPLLNVNGTFEILQDVLNYVAQYAIASVYIGLKLNPHLTPIYSKNPYLQIPHYLNGLYGDYIPDGVEERLRNLAEQKHPHYPLYKHTSCAISLVLSISDYNATIYRDPICKGSNCPAWKREICEKARSIPDRERVKDLLAKIEIDCDFNITNATVEILGRLNQEDYAFLLHQLNYPLIVRDMDYSRILHGSIFRADENRIKRGDNSE